MKSFLFNKKVLVALILPVVLLVLSFNQSEEVDIQSKYKTEYVIVLVIDGPRITETFGD